jgi:hypothetical protein
VDDGYAISNSLDELEDIKKNLYRLAEEMGIAMSDKKNIITRSGTIVLRSSK